MMTVVVGPSVRRVEDAFAVRHRALADKGALHARMGRVLFDWVQRNFEAEGALLADFPGGWPPLAQPTVRQRRRAGLGTRPLQATGRLRRGVQLRVDARAAVLDNPVPYAAHHQRGEGVPRRPFFPDATQARRLVLPAVHAHISEALQ